MSTNATMPSRVAGSEPQNEMAPANMDGISVDRGAVRKPSGNHPNGIQPATASNENSSDHVAASHPFPSTISNHASNGDKQMPSLSTSSNPCSEPRFVSSEEEENAALKAELEKFRQQHAALLNEYSKLLNEIQRKKIDSFESLAQQDKELFDVLVELMRKTPAKPLDGHNIGLFGITSTGKSMMINGILGDQRAQTGVGETTKEITRYDGHGFICWDFPGRNDEVSYFTMECVAFLKSLSKRLILIQSTIKESSGLMKLLDANDLNYTVVVNKFDRADKDEQDPFKKQIQMEIQTMGLKGVEQVYFLSAKKPEMFGDWEEMTKAVLPPSRAH